MSNQELHPLVQEWIKTRSIDKPGIYIYGNTGVGKTHNLKILKDMAKQQISFYTVPEFLNRLSHLRQQSMQDRTVYGFNYNLITKMLSGDTMFILDDFGTETLSEKKIEDLYQLINNMYEKKTTLIISSNLSLGELEKKVGDRICSRIMGMCQIVELLGNDRRFE